VRARVAALRAGARIDVDVPAVRGVGEATLTARGH
jgi:hypothetical protein